MVNISGTVVKNIYVLQEISGLIFHFTPDIELLGK